MDGEREARVLELVLRDSRENVSQLASGSAPLRAGADTAT